MVAAFVGVCGDEGLDQAERCTRVAILDYLSCFERAVVIVLVDPLDEPLAEREMVEIPLELADGSGDYRHWVDQALIVNALRPEQTQIVRRRLNVLQPRRVQKVAATDSIG